MARQRAELSGGALAEEWELSRADEASGGEGDVCQVLELGAHGGSPAESMRASGSSCDSQTSEWEAQIVPLRSEDEGQLCKAPASKERLKEARLKGTISHSHNVCAVSRARRENEWLRNKLHAPLACLAIVSCSQTGHHRSPLGCPHSGKRSAG